MEEITIWKVVVGGIVLAILSIAGCNNAINYVDDRAMVDMVSHGADPLDARCAIKTTEGAVCATRAATKNK